MIRLALILTVLFSCSLTHISKAQAQTLGERIGNLFSGDEDDGKAKPHESLEAPFATDGQNTTGNKNSLLFLYDKELTGTNDGNILSQAHRTDAQMSEWVTIVVTNLLSFNYREAQAHINKYQSLFKRPALVQYVNEINKSDIVKAMRQHGLESVAMFEEMPLVLNKGNFQSVFRWTFDFPVNVTFRYTGNRARQNASAHTIVMNVRLRIARVPSKEGLDGALIENWRMERIR